MTLLQHLTAVAFLQTVAAVAKRRRVVPAEAVGPWCYVWLIVCLEAERLGPWTQEFATLGVACGAVAAALWLISYARREAPARADPMAVTIAIVAGWLPAAALGALALVVSPSSILAWTDLALWRRVVLAMVSSPVVMVVIGVSYPVFAGLIGRRLEPPPPVSAGTA